MSAGWVRPLKDLKPREMLEVGVALERMRRRTPIGWIQSVGAAVGGAGLGAWLSGSHGVLVYGCFFGGTVAAVVIQIAIHDRSDNAANVCAEYLRLIDQWTPMGEHEHSTNSAYVRAIVKEENPSLLTRLQRMREWRLNRRQVTQP